MVIACWWQTLKLGVSCMVSTLVSTEVTILVTTISNHSAPVTKREVTSEVTTANTDYT